MTCSYTAEELLQMPRDTITEQEFFELMGLTDPVRLTSPEMGCFVRELRFFCERLFTDWWRVFDLALAAAEYRRGAYE